MSKKKFRRARRQWLNPVTSAHTGWMSTEVSAHREHGAEAWLTLADCSRTICLEFQTWTKDGPKLNMKKLDKVIGALTQFREDVEAAQAWLDAHKEEEDGEGK